MSIFFGRLQEILESWHNMKAVEQKQSKTLCKPKVLFTDAAGVV